MSGSSPSRSARFVFLTDDAAGAPDSRYAWRFDAANHRPLGRAATWTPGLDACRRDASIFTEQVAGSVGDVVVERRGTTWGWQLTAGGVRATSTHAYLRRVECLRGFAQFESVVRSADPSAGVVRCFGKNTLRGYERRETAGPAR